jgi:hypothetical protein
MSENIFRAQVESDAEIWSQADGCLMVPDMYGRGWHAFGTGRTIQENEYNFELPMFKVFDGVKFIPEALEKVEQAAARFMEGK